MKIKRKGRLALGLGAVITMSVAYPSGAHAAKDIRSTLSLGTAQLTADALTDSIIHFQLDRKPERGTNLRSLPIPVTPFVARTEYPGPQAFSSNGTSFATDELRISLIPGRPCISVYDRRVSAELTQICPLALADPARAAVSGLTFAPLAMTNVYGLGEQFQEPGETNGDWSGKTRVPGNAQGNSMVAFEGGFIGNAQFPILYALGPGKLNYAIYVDHSFKQEWNFVGDPWRLETTGDTLRFYLIAGADLPALRRQLMDLLGRPPVPPKKAFGLWVSEFGYRNWRELEDKLRTLRKNRFPLDGFVLDVYWYGEFRQNDPGNPFGHMDWDLKSFPDPRAKIAELEAKEGVGLMLAEDPYVTDALPEHRDLARRGFLVKQGSDFGPPAPLDAWWGRGGMIDFTSRGASDYWHDLKRKPLTDVGIRFHWTDLAEPETYRDDDWYAGSLLTGQTEAGNHNLYGFTWARGISEGYARDGRGFRHFNMIRSGGPGIQRFGSALWSGDIGSNLKSLSAHLNAQMHLSLSGMDYFGADIGGFHRRALQGDLKEMYTKWFAHAAAFDVPIRPHTDNGSKQHPTPPDRIGDLGSNLANLRQRYELAPYYYSLAHRAYRTGEPVIPPLVYAFQEDPEVRQLADEKMIGPSLLVATAAVDGQREREVYLPAGDWYDYQAGTLVRGKRRSWIKNALSTRVSEGTKLDAYPLYDPDGKFRLPTFARAGSILPIAWVDDETLNLLGKRRDGTKIDDLLVRIFPATRASEFTVFEDDGVTTAYQTGAVAETRVAQRLSATQAELTVDPTVGTYPGAPTDRRIYAEWVLDGQTLRAVRAVHAGGTALPQLPRRPRPWTKDTGWFHDSARGRLYVRTQPKTASATWTVVATF